jgi:hypothetical protein
MKNITRNKVQRMRNLVTGNYGAKTQTQVGYKKYKTKYDEGEVWEENGKVWTIKNGIKQNVSKLKKAREANKIPLSCPKCNGSMNKSQHKFMFQHHGHCLICQTEFERKMHNNGTYNDWVKDNVKNNFSKWKNDKKEQFNDWFSKIDMKQYITEAGLIEDWEGLSSKAKQDIIKRFEKYIQSEEEKMDKLIKEQLK